MEISAESTSPTLNSIIPDPALPPVCRGAGQGPTPCHHAENLSPVFPLSLSSHQPISEAGPRRPAGRHQPSQASRAARASRVCALAPRAAPPPTPRVTVCAANRETPPGHSTPRARPSPPTHQARPPPSGPRPRRAAASSRGRAAVLTAAIATEPRREATGLFSHGSRAAAAAAGREGSPPPPASP